MHHFKNGELLRFYTKNVTGSQYGFELIKCSFNFMQQLCIFKGLALDNMKDFAKKGEKFDFIFVDAVKKEYIDYLMVYLSFL